MKNILVITGSPRQLGNTAILADSFIQGAKAAGHKTEIFDTPFHPVQPCLACNQCWEKDSPCGKMPTYWFYARRFTGLICPPS